MIIQHLKNLFHKVDIHPLTFLYFLFAWFGGYLKWYLSILGIVCFHELCHHMMAYYFHFEIEKIEILPFGAYLLISDFYVHSIIENLCVVLAGPCSHLLMFLFFNYTCKGVYLEYLIEMNQYIFIFNCLPIYPLDGSRLMSLILQLFMDVKKALYIQLKVSIFSLVFMAIFNLRMNTFIVLSYLFFQQFIFYKDIFSILRSIYIHIPLNHNRTMKFHNQLIYRRDCHNYYWFHQKWYDEKQMIPYLLKNVKK